MKPEIFLDLELLGLPDNLAPGVRPEITEIGAVAFDENGETDARIWHPAAGNGATDAETVQWWLEKLPVGVTGEIPSWYYARKYNETAPIRQVLLELMEFMGGFSMTRRVWCRSRY
jgi:hypothetical protein